MSNSPLRCGVIGVGRMGSHHARLYAESADAELVGVVDSDPARREEAARRFGVRTFESIDQLLELKPDAVSIATPTVTHRAVGEPLLGANISCLIEKSLAPTEAVARAPAAAGERSGAVLQVGHIVRYDPVTLAVAALPAFTPGSSRSTA